MPYERFTKTREGKKKWCTRNKETGKVVCYDSATKRLHGVQMRYAIEGGWRPTGSKGKGIIKGSRIKRYAGKA